MPTIPSNLPPVNPNPKDQRQKAETIETDEVLLIPCSNDKPLLRDDTSGWKALRDRIRPIRVMDGRTIRVFQSELSTIPESEHEKREELTELITLGILADLHRTSV